MPSKERSKLKKKWGKSHAANHLLAILGAKKTGATPETVAALEKKIGYGAVMELFYKIGAGIDEDQKRTKVRKRRGKK